jgi:putative IMPACT (imprinted ancient) family translation regulator
VSDAGEPAGSAGRPILGQIDSKELTNLCVIVLRYFGGTLLGIPGLINAYKSASSMALQLIPVVRKQIEVKYEIHFDYTISNDVLNILRKFECTIDKQEMQLFCIYEIGIAKIIESVCVAALEEIYGCIVTKKATK